MLAVGKKWVRDMVSLRPGTKFANEMLSIEGACSARVAGNDWTHTT